MTRPKIFITRQIDPQAVERLSPLAEVSVWPKLSPPPYEELLSQAGQVDGMLTMLSDRIDAAFFQKCSPNFKVVSQMAVGTDNIDLKTASQMGIPVGHTPGVLTETCADFTWALLLAAARRVPEADLQVHQGIWEPWGPAILLGPELFGATLGIVGMGRIGQAVARRATGFNMRILYSHPRRLPDVEKSTGAIYVPLEELLHQSDFISLHTYLTPQTYHLISHSAFAQMKSNAILINASRGGIVDPEALLSALKDQKIRGAALDVFEQEPLPVNHPLRSLGNVVLSPHIGYVTAESYDQFFKQAVDNIEAYLDGKIPAGAMNSEVLTGGMSRRKSAG
jgi:glyoxylate reductase